MTSEHFHKFLELRRGQDAPLLITAGASPAPRGRVLSLPHYFLAVYLYDLVVDDRVVHYFLLYRLWGMNMRM